ncbi:hypothetical protein CHS0354_001118 [Potamilus streckersoni]|uniref:guanylate kinase n=1 Tax=Potamilus streckersoni TaxID=2493646 RepID=A0AAE0T5R8_9BIVA|nr:hypothetical protein CHS0354_001118 [Potamilus streckersoni]
MLKLLYKRIVNHFPVPYRFLSNMSARLRPIVMSGPSGSGKSTLLQKLFEEFPHHFAFSVSHTTRSPRPGETHGKEYFFVSREEFESMIKNKEFLEHAVFSGNRYGTSMNSVESLQKSGKICILDVEINGVKSIKKTNLNALFIFIRPPSLEILSERLRARGTESEDKVQQRLNTAQEALEYANQPGSYDHIIINDNLDTAYVELKKILAPVLKVVQNGP